MTAICLNCRDVNIMVGRAACTVCQEAKGETAWEQVSDLSQSHISNDPTSSHEAPSP